MKARPAMQLKHSLGERIVKSRTPRSHFFLICILIFFFLSMTIPTTFQLERSAILVFLVLGAIVKLLSQRSFFLHPEVGFWATASMVASIVGLIVGVLRDTPGVVAVMSVFLAWPLLFVFFISLTRNPAIYLAFLKTIVIGTFVSSALGILLIAESKFGLNFGLAWFWESQNAIAGIYGSRFEYSLQNIATIIYGLPFLIAILILPIHKVSFTKAWRVTIWLTLAIGLISLLLAGRRALVVATAMSPLVAFIIASMGGVKTNFSKTAILGLPLVIAISVAALVFFDLEMSEIWDDFLTGFDSSASDSSSVRLEQFMVLTDEWAVNPFFGNGLGAAARGIVRSDEQAWAYELSYAALLFQSGIFGFTLFFSSVMWLYWRGISLIRSMPSSAVYLVPTLTGLSSFLVANATNPYLGKFDFLWVIFLPTGIINAFLFVRDENSASVKKYHPSHRQGHSFYSR